MHPVYCDSYFIDWQYMFGVKSLLRVEKVLQSRKDLAAVLF